MRARRPVRSSSDEAGSGLTMNGAAPSLLGPVVGLRGAAAPAKGNALNRLVLMADGGAAAPATGNGLNGLPWAGVSGRRRACKWKRIRRAPPACRQGRRRTGERERVEDAAA